MSVLTAVEAPVPEPELDLLVRQPVALPRVDLLPPEIALRRRVRRAQGALGLAVAGCVLLAAGVAVLAGSAVQDAEARLEASRAVGDGLTTQQRGFSDVVETRRRAELAQEVLVEALAEEIRFSQLLDALRRTTPVGVWLKEVTLTQTPGVTAASAGVPADPGAASLPPAAPAAVGTLSLTAVGLDHRQVAEWLDGVVSAPQFRDAGLSAATSALMSGVPAVEFTASAVLTPAALSGRYAPVEAS